MTELIIALDGENLWEDFTKLRKPGRWFKLGPQSMLNSNWTNIVKWESGYKFFLDLKLADTKRTVYEAVRRFVDANISAVSTYTNEATESAARAAEGSDLKIWRVIWLTDTKGDFIANPYDIMATRGAADGIIIPPWLASKELYGDIICPAIRMTEIFPVSDGHTRVFDGTECNKRGITHAVIGRPIYQSTDQEKAADTFINCLK